MTIANFPWATVPFPDEPGEETFDAAVGSLETFGGGSREVVRQGSRWVQTVSWSLLDNDELAAIYGFFVRQTGPAGRFTMPLWLYKRRGGWNPAGATITVNGSGQLGTTLVVNNLAGSDPVLKENDMITVGDATGQARHLHMVTADVNAASGSIPIFPALLESPPSGDAVHLRSLALDEGAFHVNAIWQLVGRATKRVTSPGHGAVSAVVITAPTGVGI